MHPTLGKTSDGFTVLADLLDDVSLLSECSCRTGLDTLAATGAAAGVAPVFGHVADDAGVDAAAGDFPDVGAFHFGADANTARAENAAVVVEDEARVCHVDRLAWIVIGIASVGDAERLCERLEFAVAV